MADLNENDVRLLSSLVRQERRRQERKRMAALRQFGQAADLRRIDERSAYLTQLYRKLHPTAAEFAQEART